MDNLPQTLEATSQFFINAVLVKNNAYSRSTMCNQKLNKNDSKEKWYSGSCLKNSGILVRMETLEQGVIEVNYHDRHKKSGYLIDPKQYGYRLGTLEDVDQYQLKPDDPNDEQLSQTQRVIIEKLNELESTVHQRIGFSSITSRIVFDRYSTVSSQGKAQASSSVDSKDKSSSALSWGRRRPSAASSSDKTSVKVRREICCLTIIISLE